MYTFFLCTGLVALAEIGDKTQLLALVLAARFGRPWPIVAGIAVATLLNHALAGAAGHWLLARLGPDWLRILLALGFMAMAAWMLVPDRLDAAEAERPPPRLGVFGVTAVAFFLAEMGDKTQVATVMLAARFQDWTPVVLGTTAGMLLANAPVVWLGERITRRVPLAVVRKTSAVLFAALGVAALLG